MSCCHAASPDAGRLTVHDCFERGLATRRLPALAENGERIESANGLWARFSLQFDDYDRLADIRFGASSCTTLIAYCQALGDLNRDQPVNKALQCSTHSLAATLHGVPAAKYDRAILAIAAFRAALIESQREKPHESRLHLRDPEAHRIVRARAHDSAAA